MLLFCGGVALWFCGVVGVACNCVVGLWCCLLCCCDVVLVECVAECGVVLCLLFVVWLFVLCCGVFSWRVLFGVFSCVFFCFLMIQWGMFAFALRSCVVLLFCCAVAELCNFAVVVLSCRYEDSKYC